MLTRPLIALAGAVGVAVLAAYGSSGPSTAASAPSSGQSGASSPSGSGAGAVVVTTASRAGLGAVLVDGAGCTLYRFDADSASPPTSHCAGSCTTYWPPLLADTSAPQVKGASSALLGTLSRPDGTRQVTFAGWPLYTYTGDGAPGDATGQGVNAWGGLWWARAASGGGSGPPSAGGGAGGY